MHRLCDAEPFESGQRSRFSVYKPSRCAVVIIMGLTMTSEPAKPDEVLLERIRGGDQQALAEMYTRCRERLRRMVRLRLDRRLQGRVDASDILQEAYLDIS